MPRRINRKSNFPPAVIDGSPSPREADGEETVTKIVRAHRIYANQMNFDELLKRMERDSERAWSLYRQRPEKAFRRAAAVRSIALIQTMQHLGRLKAAKIQFDQLLCRLNISYSSLNLLHVELDLETGDDALAVYYRIQDAIIGENRFGRLMEEALDNLQCLRNQSKFLWRFEMHRLVQGNSIDMLQLCDRYNEMTGGSSPSTVNANMMGILSFHETFMAVHNRGHEANHLQTALDYTIASRRLAKRIWRIDLGISHLATHTVLATMRHEILLRQLIASRRGDMGAVRDFGVMLDKLRLLRDRAGIMKAADGFRETDQVFSGLGLARDLVAKSDLYRDAVSNSHEQFMPPEKSLELFYVHFDQF